MEYKDRKRIELRNVAKQIYAIDFPRPPIESHAEQQNQAEQSPELISQNS